MEIKKLRPDEIEDFKTLIEIFKMVFESTVEIPDEKHLIKLLSNADFMVFVVRIKRKVVGGLTIYVLHQYYQIKPQAYIYDVGIAPDFQRMGLGKALIKEACDFCRTSGFDGAYVEAESDDIDSVSFYRKTNFDIEVNATHFTYSFTDDIT